MWPFSRNHREGISVFEGFIDRHCHILPAVDDGVKSMDEAVAVLRRYEELGVAEVWLTPHVMEDMPNTPQLLRERFDRLKAAYTGSVRLHLAAENMLDNLFAERFARGEVLPSGEKGDRLLVETSYFNPPIGLRDMLKMIADGGYIPLLAHPERYIYMDEKQYHQLKEEGVEFQINISSEAGLYGRTAQKKARWLQSKGFCDCKGSDLHSAAMLERLCKSL